MVEYILIKILFKVGFERLNYQALKSTSTIRTTPKKKKVPASFWLLVTRRCRCRRHLHCDDVEQHYIQHSIYFSRSYSTSNLIIVCVCTAPISVKCSFPGTLFCKYKRNTLVALEI